MILLPSTWAQQLAQIYLYEQKEAPARRWLLILCDGVPVAKIKRGSFFAIDVAPGNHVLTVDKGVPAFLDLRAGGEAFVRLGWQSQIGEPSTLVLDKRPAAVARNEMRFVLYIDAKQVLSSAVPKIDPRPVPEPQFKRREEDRAREE